MTKTIEQKALKFIDENHLIKNGDKILVALSGGADSIFLLHFLLKFKKRFKIDVTALHLNHKLRGRSATADEKFCTEFCAKNQTKLIRVSKDVKSFAKRMKLSIEEAGRELRYHELNKAVKKIGYSKIATAHNSSDNVETILLNFTKGSGLNGLAGIPVNRKNIIRPILCLSSDEIRTYLKQNKISYRVDESNRNSDFERNFLRNEIIPKLKQRLNPRLEEKINNIAKIVSDINSYLDNEIESLKKNVLKFNGKELRIELKQILKLDKSFQKIFLKKVIEKKFNIEITSENIFSLIDLLKLQTGKSVQLKKDILATRERSEIIIGRKSSTGIKKNNYKIKIGQKVRVGKKSITIKEVNRKLFKFSHDKSVEFISGDGLINIFEIRRWKAGDKFQPIGMKGTKKISDFLADEKTSSVDKKNNLVLLNEDKIVWVIGLRIDERFKVTPKTKMILKLTITTK